MDRGDTWTLLSRTPLVVRISQMRVYEGNGVSDAVCWNQKRWTLSLHDKAQCNLTEVPYVQLLLHTLHSPYNIRTPILSSNVHRPSRRIVTSSISFFLDRSIPVFTAYSSWVVSAGFRPTQRTHVSDIRLSFLCDSRVYEPHQRHGSPSLLLLCPSSRFGYGIWRKQVEGR